MLTTITTTTTTTTAATAVGGVSQATVYGAIGVVILIVLLIAKELLSSYGAEREGESEGVEEEKGEIMDSNRMANSLATNLSVAIYPLLFSFALLVAMKVMEVL